MFSFLLFVLFSFSRYIYCIEVCEDFKYYVKPDDKHCHDNPDGERNLTEILKNWKGVTVEEHNIFTKDGYQILINRAYTHKDKNPVVLGPGAFFTTLAFANRGNKSLAHHLILEGHDLWIVNFRSGPYSRGHKSLKDTDEKYWQFSLYEMAVYDLDSALELVMEKAGKKAIYIGHGGGSTIGYIYSSVKVEAAQSNLKGIIALGHLAYMDGTKSYLRFLLPLVDYLKPVINQRLHGEFPLDWGELKCESLLDYYTYEIGKVPIYGDDFAEIDPVYLPIMRTQNKQKSVGVNVLIHLYQIMKSKKFQAFDFGAAVNQQKYGQSTPPEYNISAIPVPVTIFLGNNDWIATNPNAQRFYSQLNPDVQCGYKTVECSKWNHNDFIEAKDIELFLYGPLFEAIDNMSFGMCVK